MTIRASTAAMAALLSWTAPAGVAFAEPAAEVPGPEHDASVRIRCRYRSRPQPGPDLALLGGVVIPTGSRGTRERVGITEDRWRFQGALVASQDSGVFTVDLELGDAVPFAGERRGDRGTLLANLAGGWQVLPWLQPELELNHEHGSGLEGTPGSDVLRVTSGVVAPFGDGYRIAAGLQYPVWGRRTGRELSGTLAFKCSH